MLKPGHTLDHYEIRGLIALGGMAEVYTARDLKLDRDVAIKVVADRFLGSLRREATIVASLKHPNVCTLYDVGAGYLVMELVEGETLTALLKNGRLDIDT